jgi:sorting nexin-13
VTSLDPNAPVHSQRKSESFTVSAQITNTGICREHGKAYAVYLISVMRQYTDGRQDVWDVYRRYSDFHDLHMTIQDRVSA